MSFPSSPFWDFSTAAYARRGVAAACLRLQDRHGADVNLLLFAVWAAHRGLALDRATLDAAAHGVAAWQDNVVAPLRALRRALKADPSGAPPALAARARDRIKEAELDAEQVEQLILAPLLPESPDAPPPDDRHRLARRNLRQYIQRLGVALDDADRRALDAIAAVA